MITIIRLLAVLLGARPSEAPRVGEVPAATADFQDAVVGPTPMSADVVDEPQYDPVAQRQLGNFPRAYSMLGLPNSAVLLHEQRKAAPEPVIAA
ncbi:hypothetical protein ACF082_33995 [Streptomyces lydicus]|uniref:hypothetical protein n=1 Tax=Streptomyces lydicus TaxID=47763 RepID=UPI0036FED5AB